MSTWDAILFEELCKTSKQRDLSLPLETTWDWLIKTNGMETSKSTRNTEAVAGKIDKRKQKQKKQLFTQLSLDQYFSRGLN